MTKIEILNELNKNELVSSGIESAYSVRMDRGELLLQGEFNADLLKNLQETGHKAIVDTNGYINVSFESEINTDDKLITVIVEFVFTD